MQKQITVSSSTRTRKHVTYLEKASVKKVTLFHSVSSPKALLRAESAVRSDQVA